MCTKVFIAGLVVVLATVAGAADMGIQIKPDEQRSFEYTEDFGTPRFLTDAFTQNLGPEQWQPGSITNKGPNRNRTLTYRFFGSREIVHCQISVDQRANASKINAVNRLYLSLNGLDWTEAATSSSQKGDQNGWQSESLVISPELAAKFAGTGELWLRIVLDNFCGLQTDTSNTVTRIEVKLTVGEELSERADPQARTREIWGEFRARGDWRTITLDPADPPQARAPHYYEDSDGWLQEPDADSHLTIDEREFFPIRRIQLDDRRSPLSLAVFVECDNPADKLMAKIDVFRTANGSRKMEVLWDGNAVAAFDAASFLQEHQICFVEIPGPVAPGVHELRVAGRDRGCIKVKRIELVGSKDLRWAKRPSLPDARLEVLSAYYMPDPQPPAASQVVEGRHEKREVGMIFRGLQRLYKEHADFGGLRLIMRNTSEVPVRIKRLELNGKPVEEHYVDFLKSDWDARGVVWYRVRPMLLQPGQCGQAYIRFRRRPRGRNAKLAVFLENGKPVKAQVPYADPELTVDYVTTDQSNARLYIYARRSADVDPGRVLGVFLDGEHLVDAKIYGQDFPGGVALAVVHLAEPLLNGEYHVVGVETDKGRRVDAQFRVLPFIYPRSSFYVPSQMCREMHMNLGMWHLRGLEECVKYGIYTTASTTAASDVFDLHNRVLFALGPDEPDGHDNPGGGHNVGLGYNARRLAHSGWQELIERFAPHATSWIIMNGTTRPLNWGVYGQMADISCFDPYPIHYYGADHAYVRESLLLAQLAGAPNRMYACLETYGARRPSPAEYRQNAVQAIGAGMKGLTSWVYPGNAGDGWQTNEARAKEISKLNALIEHIEGDLLLGTPIDLAASDAGMVATGVVGDESWPKEKVWTGALLCGPDTIVIAAVNHIPASKSDPLKIEPARDVTITVSLPDYLRDIEGFEATEDGLKPFGCVVRGGLAKLTLRQIESGRVLVLRRRY